MRIKVHLSLRVAPSLISFKDHVDNFLSANVVCCKKQFAKYFKCRATSRKYAYIILPPPLNPLD